MRKIDNIHIKTLINDLKGDGISFSFDGETTIKTRGNKNLVLRLENVIFSKGDDVWKICEPIFFREYGNLTDDKTFYNYIKVMILNHFK